MVHELHKAGYQRLRICPGIGGPGAWRCAISPVSNTRKEHGALFRDETRLVARHAEASDNEYFGWRDAKTDTARELAAKLLFSASLISPAKASAKTGPMLAGMCRCSAWPRRVTSPWHTPIGPASLTRADCRRRKASLKVILSKVTFRCHPAARPKSVPHEAPATIALHPRRYDNPCGPPTRRWKHPLLTCPLRTTSPTSSTKSTATGKPPEANSSSIPILSLSGPCRFFGNPASALVATIGVNPSSSEFDPARLWGAVQTKKDWKLRLRDYFRHRVPPHEWFESWQVGLAVLGLSYQEGTAVHLDLSYRATTAMLKNPSTDLAEFRRMVEQDRLFLPPSPSLPQPPPPPDLRPNSRRDAAGLKPSLASSSPRRNSTGLRR